LTNTSTSSSRSASMIKSAWATRAPKLVDKLDDLQHELVRERCGSPASPPGRAFDDGDIRRGVGLGSSCTVTVGCCTPCTPTWADWWLPRLWRARVRHRNQTWASPWQQESVHRRLRRATIHPLQD
jgi:hypothetical protein